MSFSPRAQLGRWPIALACVIVLGVAVLLPGLGTFGLWEPQERQLADKVAPRPELEAKQKAQQPPPPAVAPVATKEKCERMLPKDPVARSLTNRAMVWGRDNIDDSDGGRRLPLALLGLLTVLASAGIAMRIGGARAGILTSLVLLAMPLLVFQSRQLLSEIGIPAGAALTLYGLIALGATPSEARARSRLLPIVDAIVAVAALVAGVIIGFLAGGALLGLLVPLGAYAVANGLGFAALPGAAHGVRYGGIALARRISPRWAIGRTRTEPTHVFEWIQIALGIAMIITGLLFIALLRSFGDSSSLVYGLLAAGVPMTIAGCYSLTRDVGFVNIDNAKALIATLAAAGIVAVLAHQIFSFEEPRPWMTPAEREVFGKAIIASGCYSPALGAIWRPEDDLRYSFDSTFEQIGYGTFPWGVIGPIAMFALLASTDRRRRMLGGVTLAWAAGAWIAAEVFQRKIGFTLYGGFPALAIAIGVWLDGVFANPDVRDASPGSAGARNIPEGNGQSIDRGMPPGAMLIGLFALLAAVDLGKDLQSFPERITSLLTGIDAIQYPKMSRLLFLPTRLWLLVFGALIGLGLAIALITWRTDARRVHMRKAARIGLAVSLAFTAALAAFWSFGWQPRLASHLSSKEMFDTFRALRKQGDQLVIMGDMGDAPASYAGDAKVEPVTTRDQIVAAVGRPNRVFAIAPQTELCQLHREIGGKPYFVIDDRNTRSLLISNKLDGAVDKNPLRTSILHEPPKNITTRPKARVVFENKIELLGWSIPRAVPRGDKFTITTYYKVLQPVGGNWRVLYHFDGALRFNGDHEPIKGRCQTATWQPGDYIVDSFTVTAGAGAFTPGPYEVWTGFFTGANPNWKNMTVSEAPADMRDTADRVKITTITLQ